MISKLKNLSRSGFVRSVVVVATGTAGAQAISMAFAPIITRLYGPEAFGMLGTFLAILTVLTPISALAYPIAIVLPKSDADAKGLAKLSTCCALFVALIVLSVLIIVGDAITEILGLHAIAGLLLFVPIAMLLSAFQQIFSQWLIREKQFKVTARVAVIQSLAVNATKTLWGFLNPLGATLIMLAIAGQALHSFLLWLGVRGSGKGQRKYGETSAGLWELAKQHRDFPLYRAPQVLLNAASESLPVLLLASLFGPGAAGFYTLGRTVMGVPASLVGKSVGDVFYPRITQAAHNKEPLFPLVFKATVALAAIGLMPFALIIAFGPWVFSVVFGEEWLTAGKYARWLAVWLYFGFVNKPAVAAIPTLGMQAWLLFYELFSTGSKVLALLWGFYFMSSDLHAIALMCVLGTVAYVILIGAVLKETLKLGV